METILEKIYYNPKEGFIGTTPLFEKAKIIDPNIKFSQVKKWLNSQNVNQIHREKTNRINYLPIFSNTPDSYQIDLTFIPKFKKINRGYEMMMTCININTRLGFVYKLKNKKETYEAIKQFIIDAKPKTITTDNGSEFINKAVKKLMEHYYIKYIQVQAGDKHKMGKVERFNRTIKERLNRYFTIIDKPIWYDVIDDIVNNYNNTVHSSIGQTPNSVTPQDEEKIINLEMLKTQAILKARHKNNNIVEGSLVRLPIKKKIFDKGEPRFTSTQYVVKEISNLGNAVRVIGKDTLYKVEDVQLVKNSMGVVQDRSIIKNIVKEHKIERQLKDLNIEQNNILQEKRQRKNKIKLDL